MLLDAGARLRAGHRWAATVGTADGQSILAKWKRRPGGGPSPVAGAPNGVRITIPDAPAGAGTAEAQAEIEVAPLPAGRYELRARLEPAAIAPGAALAFTFSDGAGADIAVARFAAPGGPDGAASITGTLPHAGGPLRLTARLAATGPAVAEPSVWLSAFEVRRLD